MAATEEQTTPNIENPMPELKMGDWDEADIATPPVRSSGGDYSSQQRGGGQPFGYRFRGSQGFRGRGHTQGYGSGFCSQDGSRLGGIEAPRGGHSAEGTNFFTYKV